jgi:(1->4)-alpha-D-glucan 1-alpha-D-glucosylmutase
VHRERREPLVERRARERPQLPYARYFDIDWSPPKSDLSEKVLLPILGDQYGRVLENQEIRAVREGGAFYAEYYDSRLPLAPQSWIPILEAALTPVRDARGAEDPAVLEIESIMTALSHLPPPSDTDPARVQERSARRRS